MTSLSTRYDEDFNGTYIYKHPNTFINNIYIYTAEHKIISERENSISEHENSTLENISKNSEILKFEDISENLDKFSEKNTNNTKTNSLFFFIYTFVLLCHAYYVIKMFIEYYYQDVHQNIHGILLFL